MHVSVDDGKGIHVYTSLMEMGAVGHIMYTFSLQCITCIAMNVSWNRECHGEQILCVGFCVETH